MTLTDKEFIKLQKNKENEDVDSNGFKEIAKVLDNGANIHSYDESSGNLCTLRQNLEIYP